jgi:multiple sugar transport system permease protein
MTSRTGLLFALPALIVLAMLIAYPVAYTGLLSVTDSQGEFVGFKNFAAVLKPRVTTQAFVNTIWWVAGSIVFQVLFGVATAILLNQAFFGRAALRSIALIPGSCRGSSRRPPGLGCSTPSSGSSTTC